MSENLTIDHETVQLRLPDTEEDLNFVRSAYMGSYWDGRLDRYTRVIYNLREAVQEALKTEVPMSLSRKLAERLEPTLLPILRPPPECRISQQLFYKRQLAIRDQIMDVSEIWLVCSPDDPWFLMGFAIVMRLDSGIVLHYLFVKQKFRKMGIGRALLEAVSGGSHQILTTHITCDWTEYVPGLLKSGYRIEHNPYLLLTKMFFPKGDWT